MSQAHDEHESPIKTPKQLILAVIFAFVVPIFAIVLLVKNVGSESRDGAGADALSAEATAARIQPVGAVTIKLEGGPLKSGEEVFKGQCTACHTAGLAGAPKFGDAAAWGPRVGQGYEALLHRPALARARPRWRPGWWRFQRCGSRPCRGLHGHAGGAKFEERAPAAPADAASK